MPSRLTARTRAGHAVAGLAAQLRAHHAATAEHSDRIARLARGLCGALDLDAATTAEVELVAILHDVGKLTIDVDVLDQATPLTAAQIRSVRRHTIEGEALLATVGLEDLARLVRATHEAWDGTGYPDGLRGAAIPLPARVVGVVDAFDAMISPRAYRPPVPRREARRRLRAGAGLQFDPRVVEAFLRAS